MKRIIRHLLTDFWSVRSAFPVATLAAIEREIHAGEKRHSGEIRFVVESSLPLLPLLRGVTSGERALDLFGILRVWDTEENSGVLIYVLLADRHVEILADRGIHRRVGPGTWREICHGMEQAFRQGRFEAGALTGIRAVSDLLSTHFPPGADNPDELSNRPLLLR